MDRPLRKFYIFILTLYTLSVVWISLHLLSPGQSYLACPFRTATTIPCPGCGLTTGTVSVLNGQVREGLVSHPLSIVLVGVLLAIPLLLLAGVLIRKPLLYNIYTAFERVLKKRPYAIAAIILMIAIWIYKIWHIKSGV